MQQSLKVPKNIRKFLQIQMEIREESMTKYNKYSLHKHKQLLKRKHDVHTKKIMADKGNKNLF